jgi:hypothetical protein
MVVGLMMLKRGDISQTITNESIFLTSVTFSYLVRLMTFLGMTLVRKTYVYCKLESD